MSKIKIVAFIVLILVSCIALFICTAQIVENVELESDPPGAKVYLIPLNEWEAHPDIIFDDNKLSYYRVPEGDTPVTTRTREKVYMVVFDLNGKKLTRKLDVMRDYQNKVKVKFQ